MLTESSNLFGRTTIFVAICCCSLGWADIKYGGGSGEPNDPYQIRDANDMQAIGADANDWDKHFILMADIDLAQFDGKDGRPEFNIIGDDYGPNGEHPFEGVFDGNGSEIWNFTYSSTSLGNIAIFGNLDGAGALIKNLGLRDTHITVEDAYNTGALAGEISDGNIVGCYAVGGSITGWRSVGGLVGRNRGATISGCHTDVAVSAAKYAGGLLGTNVEGSIIHCYSAGDVISDGAGGLIGSIDRGHVSDCYAVGDVYGLPSSSTNTGGLIGHVIHGNIAGSHSSGHVHGHSNVGGLIGKIAGPQGRAIECYSTGDVTGSEDTGGLVGDNVGMVVECYSIGNVSGIDYVGGLIGRNDGIITNSYWDIETSGLVYSDGGEPKTTSEMHRLSTFTDWDFINVWNIGENQTYPYLRTVPAGDINRDRIVNFLDLCIVAKNWCEEQ